MGDIRKKQNSVALDPTPNLTSAGEHSIATALSPAYTGLYQEALIKAIDVAVPEFVSNLEYLDTSTGAVARDLGTKLGDIVSAKDFGAVGDGVTNCSLFIQAAIDAVFNAGGGTVFLPPGTYKILTPLVGRTGVTLRGAGAQTILKMGGLTYCFQTGGTLSSNTSNTLASNAAISAQTLTLTAGKGANFAVGDYILVTSEAAMPLGASTNKIGEIARIQSIATDVLTLESPTIYAYATANTAMVRKITMIKDFRVSDLVVDGSYDLDPVNNQRGQTVFMWCVRPKVTNCIFKNLAQQAVIFGGCVGGVVENCHFEDLQSNDASNFGYCLLDCAVNTATRMINCTGERVRHMYTTTDSSTPFAPGYGQTSGSRIVGCTVLWPRAAGFDTHEGGLDVGFSNCTVIGGGRSGFQLRSLRTSVTDCTVTDCVGQAVYIDSSAQDSIVKNVFAIRTNTGSVLGVTQIDRGAIFDNGLRSSVEGCRIELCGGPGIEAFSGSTGFSYENNTIRNPCQLTASNTYGIFINTSSVIDVDIHRNYITCTDTKTTNGIRATSSNITGFVVGNNVRGVSTPYNFGGAIQAQLNLPADFISVGQANGITIASDTIDVSAVNSGLILLSGEGGAADNLQTINGGTTGQKLQFKRNAVNITVKHGTGNIQLKGAVDRILGSSFANLVLRKDGGSWVEDGL